jgi:MFS family permease
MTLGCGSALLPGGYIVFLATRIVWGFGFGLFVSFMGAATVKWYAPSQRAFMNTLNGLYPFLGLAVCYNLSVPVLKAVGNNLLLCFALWAVLTIAGLVLWLLSVHSDEIGYATTAQGRAEQAAEAKALDSCGGEEQGLYKNLLRRKEIVCLCLIFVADFFCVQYVATVMPDFFMGGAGLSAGSAALLVGLFFPCVGIAGAIFGGLRMEKTGLRRPILIASTLFKFLGILLIVLGAFVKILPLMIAGLTLFSLGNSIWMPVLYTVITELDDMNPARSAGAFALVTSMGFVAGFLSPLVGGALADMLSRLSGLEGNAARMFGYTWSMAAFSLICFVGLLAALRIRETGPGSKSSDLLQRDVQSSGAGVARRS